MAADVYFGHRGRSPQRIDRASIFRYDDSITSANMSIDDLDALRGVIW